MNKEKLVVKLTGADLRYKVLTMLKLPEEDPMGVTPAVIRDKLCSDPNVLYVMWPYIGDDHGNCGNTIGVVNIADALRILHAAGYVVYTPSLEFQTGVNFVFRAFNKTEVAEDAVQGELRRLATILGNLSGSSNQPPEDFLSTKTILGFFQKDSMSEDHVVTALMNQGALKAVSWKIERLTTMVHDKLASMTRDGLLVMDPRCYGIVCSPQDKRLILNIPQCPHRDPAVKGKIIETANAMLKYMLQTSQNFVNPKYHMKELEDAIMTMHPEVSAAYPIKLLLDNGWIAHCAVTGNKYVAVKLTEVGKNYAMSLQKAKGAPGSAAKNPVKDLSWVEMCILQIMNYASSGLTVDELMDALPRNAFTGRAQAVALVEKMEKDGHLFINGYDAGARIFHITGTGRARLNSIVKMGNQALEPQGVGEPKAKEDPSPGSYLKLEIMRALAEAAPQAVTIQHILNNLPYRLRAKVSHPQLAAYVGDLITEGYVKTNGFEDGVIIYTLTTIGWEYWAEIVDFGLKAV